MIKPTLQEAIRVQNENTIIPVSEELFSDTTTPILVLHALKNISSNTFLFESVEGGKQWGRYSFLGYNPKLKISCNEKKISEYDFKTKKERKIAISDSPNDYLRDLMHKYKSPKFFDLPDFTGGLVGSISYDYLKYSHKKIKFENKSEPDFNDFELMLYDKVIVFDHVKAKIFIIVNIETCEIANNYRKAEDEIKKIKKIISKNNIENMYSSKLNSEFYSLFSEAQFNKKVIEIKKHIYEGDIFQAVLSNRFFADFHGDLVGAYRSLRTTNPSPYMFYICMDNIQIAGASPETLVKLSKGILQTHPIAGTCPRDENDKRQKELIRDLLNDEKELSEHNMLVDLGRNDLGKVCEFGTVKVTEYMQVLKFSHVIHLSSKVTGNLSSKNDCFDAISSILPAGTLSGAPKARACEIINEIEGYKRGVYGGAIGYIDFFGDMDFCIAIRMAVKKDNKVYVQAGAGIVADSIPSKEYQECIHKAKAMISAIEAGQEVM